MKDLSAGRHIAPCVITRLAVAPGSTRLHGSGLRILEAHVTANGADLCVLATHWTSQLGRNGGHGEEGREKYARTIRQVVRDHTRKDPAADILVCGDFNTVPGDPELADTLKAVGDRSRVRPSADDPFLLDLMAGKPAEKYGTLWYKEPLIYDHLCVSAGLLDPAGWACDPDSVATASEGLTRPGATRRQPWRFGDPGHDTKPGDRGYSDHFPVTVRLTVGAVKAE